MSSWNLVRVFLSFSLCVMYLWVEVVGACVGGGVVESGCRSMWVKTGSWSELMCPVWSMMVFSVVMFLEVMM